MKQTYIKHRSPVHHSPTRVNFPWIWLLPLAFVLPLFIILYSIFFKPASHLSPPPTFHRQLFSPWEFSGTVNSADMTVSMSKTSTEGKVEVKRNGSKIEFAIPLNNSNIKQDKNEVVFSIPEQTIESRYKLIENGVKEEIILHKIPQENRFPIKMSLTDLEMRLTRNNIPVFYKNNQYQFHFQRPFVKDAKGNVSYNVKYTIINKSLPLSEQELKIQNEQTWNGNIKKELLGASIKPLQNPSDQTNDYVIYIEIDQNWLHESSRILPITIDPTIVYDTTVEFAAGQFNRTKDIGSDSSPKIDTPYQEIAADINTVGLWHMNETSENTCSGGEDVCDSSGNGGHGTSTNTTINTTTQQLGAAARTFIRASSQRIDFATFNLNTGYTLEAWFNPSTLPASNSDWHFIGYNSKNLQGLALTKNGSGVQQIAAYHTRSDGVSESALYSITLSTNTWYHIASTWDGSVVKLYLNGIEVATQASTSISTSGTGSSYIGAFNGPAHYFNGSIDEVRVSNIVRSPEEIKINASRTPYGVYTSDVIDLTMVSAWNSLTWTEHGVTTGDGETIFSSVNLVAQWNLNETSGTTADNAEGTAANDGTLVNMTTTNQDAAAGDGWTANNKRWGAGALMFDGVDGHVTFTDNLSVKTLETWINPTAIVSINILQLAATATVTTDTNGKVIAGAGFTTPTIYVNGQSTNLNLISGQWNHVVITTETTVTTSTPYLGRVGTSYFKGIMDSTRIYSRALTVSEIMSNYQAGNIEIQTRIGDSTSPDDGSWEAWIPNTNETQVASMDTDASNWATDATNLLSGGIILADASFPLVEGAGSQKIIMGAPAVDGNTVALWHLDETGGSSAYIKDSTSNASDLTPTNTTVVSGFYSKSRNFDGSGDFLSIVDTATLDFAAANNFTVEGWIKHNGTIASANDYIVTKADITKADTTTGGYKLYMDDTGDLCFAVDDDSSWTPDDYACTSGIDYDDNKWHYAVGVKTGTTKIELFVDGASVASDPSIAATNTLANGNAFYIGIDRDGSSNSWDGYIDEVKISNTARTADEIAEAYRAGKNHRFGKTIASTDLSSKNKLPFYIAADRPGTYLETTMGESSYVNYETDANTIGLWHMEEAAGTGAYIKDSSGNGHNGTPSGATYVDGKIGKARNFNGSSHYVSLGNNIFGAMTGSFTINAWIKTTDTTSSTILSEYQPAVCGDAYFYVHTNGYVGYQDGGVTTNTGNINVADGLWHHVAYVYNGSTGTIYTDAIANADTTAATWKNTCASTDVRIGSVVGNYYFTGSIDEVRVSNSARTADEIRQTYEIGRRTHPITIDFVAKGDAGNLITATSTTASTDYSFTVDATTYGLSNKGSKLYIGDKIIVKENYNGTESIAQGTVTAVTASTGAVTVATWDSGSTFPDQGGGTYAYTTNANFFKWQREYFDIRGSLSTQRDAITRLTYRITDGSQGANIWLDDIRSTGDYLTNPINSIITSSTNSRYFQFRALFSSWDPTVSATLSATTIDYRSIAAPTTCTYEATPSINQITINWNDPNITEDGYYIEKSTDGSAFSNLTTTAANAVSYADSSVSVGHTYQYRIRATIDAGYSEWCTTSLGNFQTGSFKFEGLKMEGIRID